jgi:hypothetical protein
MLVVKPEGVAGDEARAQFQAASEMDLSVAHRTRLARNKLNA